MRDPLPPDSMLKKMLSLCADGQFFFEAHRRTHLTFSVISGSTCLLSNQTKTNIDSGGGGREICNFTPRK